MVPSKTFLSLWEPDPVKKKLLNEIETQQVVFYSRERITATWPYGYDTSVINKRTGDPAIILRSILEC